MPSSCLTGTFPKHQYLPEDADIRIKSRLVTPDMQAPAKQVVLTNTKNKIQVNAMLTEGILDSGYFTEATRTIAGVCDVPVEITGGLRIDIHDLRSTHEEADILIAQHAISLSLLDKSVRVVCDDTDILSYSFPTTIVGANVATVPQ